ncbi:Cysteine-rich receptor-like protein kinase 42 [Platanthera guangdongensis]|uniref:Cysteine-rich receptor-like protein kinase 42 n=1 Tax=Platanthera guangdongensis TaxID=2320717 RepID=A0ABR2LG66_9ASPA
MPPSGLLLLLLGFAASLTSGDSDNASPAVFLSVCGKNQTRDAEGFDVNFVESMEKIFQNISTSGFATSSSGQNLTVYGLGQCFSYLSPVNCQLCYSQSRVKLPLCLPSTSARIYLDGCFLEYSNRNVEADSVDASDAYACGNATIDERLRPAFSNSTAVLMGNLTAGAESRADYYQVGSVAVSPDLTAYGMAQCWRSLNATGCKECLEKGRANIVGKCLPAGGAMAMNAGCFLRYSTEPFYANESSSAGGSGGNSSGKLKVIIAVTTVLGVLVAIGMAVLWWNRRSASRRRNHDEGENSDIIRSIVKSHLSFKYEDLVKATDNFHQNNKLGQGGYGAVYKGILPDGTEVAVKRLFFNTRNWVDQFFNEVTLINQVQHKNLVKLLGCSVEGSESLLVYEFLSNTSLDHYLFDSFKKTALTWERRFDIIVGTAEGLAYLHNASDVRIIHRDIKASNILLDEKFRAKISDFGLARYFADDQSHLSTGLAGTFGYMAPEYIVHGQLTEKADVYSYGVVVLEIVTGRKNQTSISASAEGHSLMQQVWQHYNSETLIRLLDPDLQGKCTDEEALKLFRVGLLCVQASPMLRPAMWKVVAMLMGAEKDLPAPTQPPFLNNRGGQRSGNGSEMSNSLSVSTKFPEASVSDISLKCLELKCLEGSICGRDDIRDAGRGCPVRTGRREDGGRQAIYSGDGGDETGGTGDMGERKASGGSG